MDKRILPIETSPLLISDFDHSEVTGVILAQAKAFGKDVTPWLCGQMANFRLKTDLFGKRDTDYPEWCSEQKIIFKYSFQSDTRMPFWNSVSVQDMLIESICRDEYLCAVMNAGHLSSDAGYGTFSRNIRVLIYGFDRTKKEFYYARFFPSAPITLCVASFEEAVKAISEREDHRVEWDGIRFNPEFAYELDETDLCRDLFDFITPRDKYTPIQHVSTPFNGIDYLGFFRMYLCRMGVDHEYIDRGLFASIYDYQSLLCIRLKYMKENGILPADSVDPHIMQLQQLSGAFLTGCVSYNREHNENTLKQIIVDYDQIADIDLRVSEEMWRALKARVPVYEPEIYPFPWPFRI